MAVATGTRRNAGAGETYGLPGPNGAGETTSMYIGAGLIPADSGSVTVAGEASASSSAIAVCNRR